MASLSGGAAVAQPCVRSVDTPRLAPGFLNAILRVQVPAHTRNHAYLAKRDLKIASVARKFVCAAEVSGSQPSAIEIDSPLAYDGVIFDMVSKRNSINLYSRSITSF